MGLMESIRSRILKAVLEPFGHGSDPLAETLSHEGDPGLFGPESVTWPLMADAAAIIGGVRALLIQFAHPEVAAGMVDHSSYERDHLGRISRTTDYVSATTFGAMVEVEAAIARVRRAHRPIVGTSHRDRDYTADDSDLASWVHNALAESFLVTYQAFGPHRLSGAEADQYALEQTRLGKLIGADECPPGAVELSLWIESNQAVGDSPGAAQMVPFIAAPPTGPMMLVGYKLVYWAACATIPRRLRRALGIRRYPGAILAGRVLVGLLRWALGHSPAWLAATIRCGVPRPTGVRFRQPLPGRQSVS